MKILFVGRNCKVGGGCTFRFRASQGLIARGHTVHLAAQNGPMAPRFQEIGVSYHRIWPTPFNRIPLALLLKREKFDLIHACNPTAGDDLLWARKKSGQTMPLFISIHGNLPDYVQGNECLKAAGGMTTFDQSALDRLRKFEFLNEREIPLLPRPIEERERQAPDDSQPKIVMVSRLSGKKGPVALALLDAFEKLLPQFPGARLDIVGGGSMQAQAAQKCAEINARAGREIARALGSIVDPFPAMSDASAVIGTSYVALEALFHGIPVVAAGYEGYGVVNEENLNDAVACNFGDGYPGVLPVAGEAFFLEGLERVLSGAKTKTGALSLENMKNRLRARHSVGAVAETLEGFYRKAGA